MISCEPTARNAMLLDEPPSRWCHRGKNSTYDRRSSYLPASHMRPSAPNIERAMPTYSGASMSARMASSSSSVSGLGRLTESSTSASMKESGLSMLSETTAKSVRWPVAHTTPPVCRLNDCMATPPLSHDDVFLSQ
eukprot:scaffold90241_cov93-Phaeocystis_antarctica.AAC.2